MYVVRRPSTISWWDYQYVDEATEKEHIKLAVEVQQKTIGQRPLGIYQVDRER